MNQASSDDRLGRIREDLRRRRAERRGRAALDRGAITPADLDALWTSRTIDEVERTLETRTGLSSGDLDALDRKWTAAAEPASPSFPTLLGHRYRLLEKIGEGAMSVVFRGLDQQLNRPVAVKLLRETLGLHATNRERFLREARTLARLDHPHIVKVFDVGDEEGRLYLVLELVEGASLQALLEKNVPERGKSWAMGALVLVARGLQHAHEKGIVHRDLKPENVLVTAAGEPKVADFGLAHLTEPTADLTRSGAILGTPLYMAPEQVKGGSDGIRPATDIYALGAILYRIAAGRAPFDAGTIVELYDMIATREPLPLRKRSPGTAWQLEAISGKALEKDPARRYATAEDFARDLERYLKGESVLARPPSAPERIGRMLRRHRGAAALVVALALTAVLAFAFWTQRDARDRDRTKALALLEAARPPLERASAALYRGDARFEALHAALSEARTRTEEALRLSPELPVAHHRRGEILELQGDYEGAEASWRRAVGFDPRLGSAQFRLGRVLLWRAYLATTPLWEDPQGERRVQAERLAREGAASLARAESLTAGFDSEIQRRAAGAMLHYLREERRPARELCEKAIQEFSGREGVEEFHWLRALLEEAPKARIAAVDRAIELKPGNVLALYVRADARMRDADEAGTFADYDRALQVSPEFPEARLYRGASLYRQGKAPGAFADFDLLIQRGALLAAAYNGRGSVQLDLLRNPAAALLDFNEAIRIQPEHYALPYIGRGKAYMRLRRYAEAEVEFTRAMTIVPWHAVHNNRMEARILDGNRAGALEDLQKLRPAGWTRRDLEKDLDQFQADLERRTKD